MIDKVTRALVAQLDHPDWKWDQYKGENDTLDAEIWIANGAWALRYKIGHYQKGGGAVFFWVLQPWRWFLWAAIQKRGRNYAMRKLAR